MDKVPKAKRQQRAAHPQRYTAHTACRRGKGCARFRLPSQSARERYRLTDGRIRAKSVVCFVLGE